MTFIFMTSTLYLLFTHSNIRSFSRYDSYNRYDRYDRYNRYYYRTLVPGSPRGAQPVSWLAPACPGFLEFPFGRNDRNGRNG